MCWSWRGRKLVGSGAPISEEFTCNEILSFKCQRLLFLPSPFLLTTLVLFFSIFTNTHRDMEGLGVRHMQVISQVSLELGHTFPPHSKGRLSHGGLATHPKRWESKFARHPSKLYPRKIAGARLDPSVSEYLLLVTAHNGPQVGNTRRSGTVQRQSGLSVPLRAFSEHSMMVVWTESWDERGGDCLCPGLREGFKAEAFKWVCAGWVWLCEKEKGAVCTRIGRGGRQSNVNEEWSHRASWGRRRVEMVCWE